MDSYYIRSRGRVTGPFDEMVLRRMIARGHVTRVHELSTDGVNWVLLTDYPQFITSVGSLAPGRDPRASVSLPPAPPALTAQGGLNEEIGAILKGTRGWFGRNEEIVRRGVLIGGTLTACFFAIVLVRWGWQSFSSNHAVTEEELYSKLQASVGRVIVGAKGTNNSTYFEYPHSTGTAFLVSSHGYYLTNRHVIEKHIPFYENADLARRKSTEISAKTGTTINLNSQIWLLIQGEKYPCELVHFSKHFDLAILKAQTPGDAISLGLSTKQSIAPPAQVYAAGFPSVNDEPLSEEAAAKLISQATISDIKSQFSSQALTLQVNSGSVNLTLQGDKDVSTIKHQAVVNPGNSGGPLLNTAGIVIGINTTVSRIHDSKDATFEAASYAPIIAQMRREIDQHVPGVTWQD